MKKRLLILFVGLFSITIIGWSDPSMDVFHSSMGGSEEYPGGGVYGRCTGIEGPCTAVCPQCKRPYYANANGKGKLTRGKCQYNGCNCNFEAPEGEVDPGPGHGD